jgi:hypothetical protein
MAPIACIEIENRFEDCHANSENIRDQGGVADGPFSVRTASNIGAEW